MDSFGVQPLIMHLDERLEYYHAVAHLGGLNDVKFAWIFVVIHENLYFSYADTVAKPKSKSLSSFGTIM